MNVLKAHAARSSVAALGMVVYDLAMTSQSDTLTEIKFDLFVLSEDNSICTARCRNRKVRLTRALVRSGAKRRLSRARAGDPRFDRAGYS
jgi:hypothetical protein